MSKNPKFKRAGVIAASVCLLASAGVVTAGEWHLLPASQSVEEWKFTPETTKVERVPDPDNTKHEVIQIQGTGASGGELQHAIASFASPRFENMPNTGGTLFFRMRFESGLPFNGRVCFSPVVLNAASHSCGFRFNGAERIGFSGLDSIHETKGVFVQTAQWFNVWFSPNPSDGTATVMLDFGDGKPSEFKVRIAESAAQKGNPLSYFGLMISKLDAPRPVLVGNFYWSNEVTTEMPPEATGL